MDRQNLRLLDANFNRAREALRVMEDFGRFILNDTQLSSQAKQLRHDLCSCISQIPTEQLLGARDIIGDVGTVITTASEQKRCDHISVLQAAAKRLTEALRCLEEYSKIDYPHIAVQIEALRYRGYHLEKQLLCRAIPADRMAEVRLYVLLTQSLCQLPILQVAQQVLDGGADCIQLREKEMPDGKLLLLAGQIAQLCHEAGALFIMNDRPDLAVLADADGLHLGQGDLPPDQARKVLRPGMIVGQSSHNIDEAKAVLAGDTDYIALGSIFPSSTKPQVPQSGLAILEQVRKLTARPIIAIGGINSENAHQAIAAGASGVAVCQGVIAGPNPQQAARDIKEKLLL